MSRRPRSWSPTFQPVAFAQRRLPDELTRPIATTGDGRDITRRWVQELEEPGDRRLAGATGWGVYDRVLLDDQVKSCLEQRIRAVVSREWDVLPGDEDDPRSVAAGEAMKAQLERIGWDRVTEKMLSAGFYGYSVGELNWGAANGVLGWVEGERCRPIHVRHARRFRFDTAGRLRLLTRADRRGELLPDRKFWVVSAGGTDDDQPYGRGLAEWLYWPTLFKRNGVRFWNIFLDKFSVPTAKGTYPRGSTQKEIDKLLGALQAIATDAGIAVPEGMAIELLDIARSGADFAGVCRYMDGAIAKVILSQTMTTDDGSSRAQGEVHADVKLEIVKADADLLSESFNTGPARWWTDLNFGADVAAPRVVRIVEEEDDLKDAADTDEVLTRTGWRRTDESFRDRYGDGYERAPAPTPPAAGQRQPPANENARPVQAVAMSAADPRPLRVYRRVRNAAEIVAWAREQGFTSVLPPQDLHVTVAYSKRPVNWFTVAGEWTPEPTVTIEAGGPRVVDRLGADGALVLHFFSGPLTWRNQAMRDAGASWDHADYLPHITLTYVGGDLDLSAIEPYRGRIELGPEVFEDIDDGWVDQRAEVAFAEAASYRDVVDEAVDAALADDGWREAWAPTVEPLLADLAGATSPDDVKAVLARAAELGDDADLGEALARAAFATRIDGLTGGEG